MKPSFSPQRHSDWGLPSNSLAVLLGAVIVFGMTCGSLRAQSAEVYHLGFEPTDAPPGLFIPADSQDKKCTFDLVRDNPHSGDFCGRMSCADFGRFAIFPKIKVPLSGAGRYRISAWVRAGEGFVIQDSLPGFLIRLNMPLSPPAITLFHILPDGRVSKDFVPHVTTAGLPTTWTQIGAVFDFPATVSALDTNLFVAGGKGDVFVDDLSLEKVPDDTPLTPVLSKDTSAQ